ncbi:MAG: hypothetical protein KIT84_34175 [Labilithrix sp.]|nr:hypothetical protein [Labilithrix sp.]MCW5816094.1 hypothetical protein [Labilithrix sp.]
MRLSKLAAPFLVLLALAAGAGCAPEEEGEDTVAGEEAITGSVQGARIARIKQAYVDAKLEDFSSIEPLIDVTAWGIGAIDPHWFSFPVDDRNVVLVDFVAETNKLLAEGLPGELETFVLIYDVAGAAPDGGGARLNPVLLYRADRDQWIGVTRHLQETTPSLPSADGGLDAGPYPSSDGGLDAGPYPSSDGGLDAGPRPDGGSWPGPSDAGPG